jgi:hypothetical protein
LGVVIASFCRCWVAGGAAAQYNSCNAIYDFHLMPFASTFGKSKSLNILAIVPLARLLHRSRKFPRQTP